MSDSDAFRTHRDVLPFIAEELSAAGFDDVHEIGRGGFGVVYRCIQSTLDRTVAVKVLTTDMDNDNRARFLREQRAMGRLTGHPNIMSVLEVGATDSGRPYLVMPFHSQDSLDIRIRRHGPLTVEEVLRLGVKTAGGLETAHRAGIVHRDVKPANILLSDFGEPVLADFGIAHVVDAFKTTTGTVTGSPAFTAPEVLSGDSPTPASDVYGLGATLFTALTGHAAFERRSGEQVVAQFLRITTQPVPDLRIHGFADEVSAAIEYAMSRTAADRPSAAAFGERLQQIQAHLGFAVDEIPIRTEPATPQGGDNSLRPVSGATDPQPNRQPSAAKPSVSDRRGNLPLDLTSFVGRRAEVTEGKTLLSASRLVTLTGIGGVGKTRLALRVADKVQRTFREGVWLVELGDLRDGQLLSQVVATALNVRHEGADPLQILVDYLATRELLLVLDNCEQVIDAAAEMSIALLRSCPGLRILATSREALGIGGEAVLRVPPLTVPDPDQNPPVPGSPNDEALALFAERAVGAVPGFKFTEETRVTAAQICYRLDGLPLAIELAAARLRAMTPDQILQRLADRYALLTRGSRGAPTRQQTLQWSIDWSHDLCTPAEQQLWARLAVFAGPFELDAASFVTAYGIEDEGDDLLEQVTSLVDKSILIREEAGMRVRFRMLETLRDYGQNKLQLAGELRVLRSQHRDWYRQTALDAETEWISPRQLDWLARLDREQPNLREAMEFSLSTPDGAQAGLEMAAALLPFWYSRGLFTEGRRWIERALACEAEQPPALRIKGLYAASILATRQDDLQRAIALLDEGHAIADSLGTTRDRALIQRAQGYLALHRDNPEGAVALLSEAMREFRRDDDLTQQIMTLHGLGLAHQLLGQPKQAIDCLEEANRIARTHGESASRGRSLWNLGLVVWQEGNRDRAVELLREGLELARQSDDPTGATWCFEVLAWIEASENRFHRAAALMAAAWALRRQGGISVVQIANFADSHDECERITRQGLGSRAFSAASREGDTMSFESAVSFALEEPSVTPARSVAPTLLTKREQQVADLVARGMTNKEIAAQLVISPRTAQGHVEHVLTKLGFSSRAQIAAWVVEHA
ncbi:protein kinase/ transcriptional regulator, LuxR family (plasmid) [Rhodococcus jostii RHA1]|jgi:non-specific serine/threonine protein kinase|uniref:Protein kinase/ transcriptional regulator, LuxR family n=1 Tax=Rhodococcus jostii (strain RHA1) TaxID=101510 RepID=Q0RVV8_RHOJR|nr:protein kinase [Rhodococcus jostii]ABH00578.1 protein kinase/ transcriptional regulator, LuxR family [Rhodococcus jostii RHA1]